MPLGAANILIMVISEGDVHSEQASLEVKFQSLCYKESQLSFQDGR